MTSDDRQNDEGAYPPEGGNRIVPMRLQKFFAFLNGEFAGGCDAAAASNACTAESNARNVLDAHQTLMDIDEANVPKFEKVVEFVKKDIDKMEQGGKD